MEFLIKTCYAISVKPKVEEKQEENVLDEVPQPKKVSKLKNEVNDVNDAGEAEVKLEKPAEKKRTIKREYD